MHEKFLESIGLSDKEAKVYIALLEVDNDSVIDLAKKTKINRTTIYPVLEALSKKGLVSEIKIDKKIHYGAEPPERLETYIERRKIQLEEQGKRLKDIIPQLKSIQRESGQRPVIRYFEGKEGALSANMDYVYQLNNTSEDMYIIYPKDLVEDVFTNEDLKKVRDIRKNKKIKAISVFTQFEGKNMSDSYSDRVKIDHTKYPLKADISVLEDKIRITTLDKKVSTLLINDKDIATTLKSMIKHIHDSEKEKRG